MGRLSSFPPHVLFVVSDHMEKVTQSIKEQISIVMYWLSDFLDQPALRILWPFTIVMLVSWFVFFLAICVAERGTGNWYMERHPVVSVLEDYESQCQGSFHASYSAHCGRLAEQAVVVDARASHHFTVMRKIQVRHFGFLAASFWSGTLAGVFVLIIGKKGWDHLDHRLLSAGMAFGVGSAFFGGFPALMGQNANIAANESAYIGYSNLSEELRTFLATGRSSGGLLEPAEFIYWVDANMKELNRVHVQFNEDQVDLGAARLMAQQPE